MIEKKINFNYCAAIRTLGTAGKKYLQTLKSINSQTIKAKKILVYIAEGYAIPKETIGIEQYIYCKKGMVAQRALQYNEIDTEYILFLDDDVCFPPDFVENLFIELVKNNGDCISPNTFPNHEMSFLKKILSIFSSFTFPMKDTKWAFIIRESASYSYNNKPSRKIYLSQSAAGPCCLCKMSAYKAIHFEDEIWIDRYKYALGDDLLFFYKFFINGYKLLVYYNSGIIHLNAKSGHNKNRIEREITEGELDILLWHRISYKLSINNIVRIKKIIALILKLITKIFYKSIIKFILGDYSFKELRHYLKGIRNSKQILNTSEYINIPPFKFN